MPDIRASIACNLDLNILQTALPLFSAETVEAIEWSFDTLFKVKNIPDSFIELLKAFGKEERLIGHGVFFSMFSGKWSAEQDHWLKHLEKVCSNFQFDHITEHFGFMTGANFHQGAPISIPFNQTTLAIGHDRLKRIYNTCQCPVGLENLAFSYSLDEVKRHGEFLEKLIAPINGFIILDLHNLYCQLHNFGVDYADLIKLYPLNQVREIHISGGSWNDSELTPSKKIRRDTHDDSVPAAVFELLEKTIPQCNNLKFVVLEQIGTGLKSEESKKLFQADFAQMKKIIRQTEVSRKPNNNFLPTQNIFSLHAPIENIALAAQQKELSTILETADGYLDAQSRLQQSSLAATDWEIEKWEPHMLETVVAIAQKWKDGF